MPQVQAQGWTLCGRLFPAAVPGRSSIAPLSHGLGNMPDCRAWALPGWGKLCGSTIQDSLGNFAEPGPPPLWSQSHALTLSVPVPSHDLASRVQLPPPETFLPNFVDLKNLQLSAQNFPWPGGSGRESLERLEGPRHLGVGTEPRAEGWGLDPAPSGSCSFNSCWPGLAWAPALPPVQL